MLVLGIVIVIGAFVLVMVAAIIDAVNRWLTPRCSTRPSTTTRARRSPDLDALEHLHHDEMLGDHDAAVVDKEEADG